MKLAFAFLTSLAFLSAAPNVKTPAPTADTAIEQNIRARFAKSKIAADKFQVTVQGGVATIEGRTEVIQRKGVATRLARLGGARQVVNRVQVSENARGKASANLKKAKVIPETGKS